MAFLGSVLSVVTLAEAEALAKEPRCARIGSFTLFVLSRVLSLRHRENENDDENKNDLADSESVRPGRGFN
jgi:hypothetical protein